MPYTKLRTNPKSLELEDPYEACVRLGEEVLGLDIDGTDLTIGGQIGAVTVVRAYWITTFRSVTTVGPERERKISVFLLEGHRCASSHSGA